MDMLRLKLMCRNGSFVISVAPTFTVPQLKEVAAAVSHLPVTHTMLSFGYPPMPLVVRRGPVMEAGIKSGQMIIVEQSQPVVTAADVAAATAEAEAAAMNAERAAIDSANNSFHLDILARRRRLEIDYLTNGRQNDGFRGFDLMPSGRQNDGFRGSNYMTSGCPNGGFLIEPDYMDNDRQNDDFDFLASNHQDDDSQDDDSQEMDYQTGRSIADVPLMLRRVVPDDNSCLFTSLGFVISGGDIDMSSGTVMREIIGNKVEENPDEFNEAVLERPNEDYCNWIRSPVSRGGPIEMSILANFYRVEINVIDTDSGSISQFGEDKNFRGRVFLIYDGIHYDPLFVEAPYVVNGIQTMFKLYDLKITTAAQILAREASANRQFANVRRLTLRCVVCGCFLTGHTQAQRHAVQTDHTNFIEY